MEKFIRLTAKACPLMIPNLNTDQILPAHGRKVTLADFKKWIGKAT
jgi:3-isopropylmalate dehydratase small subunit